MTNRQATIETLLDHYDQPRNYGPLPDADASASGGFAECDDTVTVYLQFDQRGERVNRMTFAGQGCSISQGVASILTELVPGMTLDALAALTPNALFEIVGREVVAARPKCASLALNTVQQAIYAYRKRSAT